MKKKILSMLLATVMVCTILPTSSAEVKAETSLHNPGIVEDSSMTAGQKVTWDCVWFGSYPQTEIVANESDCGTYGKDWSKISDYEVNISLYNQLSSATGWDSNGDITLGETRYRRITKSDVRYPLNGNVCYYDWSDWDEWNDTYHYFRYESIKWRVLNVDGNQALLLADEALDEQRYYPESTSITWEKSTIRSWLNGYDSSTNSYGTDYSSKNFIDTAFTSEEQSAVLDTDLDNSTTGIYSESFGGNDTTDKVFLLSDYDMYNTDASASYGFYKSDYDKNDEARQCQSSTYAKAMKTYITTNSSYVGNTVWWLRSPGSRSDRAGMVKCEGFVEKYGNIVDWEGVGVRPALNLNLSSSSWSNAGIVCSNGTVDETHTHSWDKGKITKNATNTSASVKTYTCSNCGMTKTEAVGSPVSSVTLYRYVNKSYKLTSASTASWSITSGSSYASLKGSVLTVKKAGTVKVKDSTSGKSVTITIKTPTISTKSKVSVKAGKTLQLKATAIPKATVKYSVIASKYKKYATVTSNGKVKGIKKGTCYIYATANGVKTKIKVTVK